MLEHYRKLIADEIQKIDDEIKLHEIYVMALMATSKKGDGENE